MLQFGDHGLGALTPEQVNVLSPVALAYIGDAVYELFVRGMFLFPP
ncbi:MAG: Mini-ribonuclease 3, partial [Nodosilinea sp.]